MQIHFFLCGFMASGKSTLLDKLRKDDLTGRKFYDLDDEIFALYGRDYSDLGSLIIQIGFKKFRELEYRVLRSFTERKEPFLMALGGGTLEHVHALKIIESRGFLIFLNTPLQVCLLRLQRTLSQRPLASRGKITLKAIYQKRVISYNKSKIRGDFQTLSTLWPYH